ncbi:MAG: RNA 2',3'-cyclic phosphodiesterase [Chloroflexi bacterium]|nr:RNA 2',3'-cyclic phosphodiesterase [Chloroflexota bacterium]
MRLARGARTVDRAIGPRKLAGQGRGAAASIRSRYVPGRRARRGAPARNRLRRVRVFVAVTPDPGTRRRLAAVLEGLDDRGLLRRVPAQNLHLTLAFLGEISPTRADSAACAVSRIGPGIAPFRLDISGALSVFGSRRSILAAAVGGDLERLERLRDRLQTALAEEGLPTGERSFRLHLTLARIRPRASGRERTALRREVASLLAPVRFSFRIEDLGLYRSRIGTSGASYQLLERAELG